MPGPQNMTEAQTPMKEDVAPGTADRSGTTEPQVLFLGDTYKCPLAGDPGRRRPEPESSGVRRIRRTDLSTDWGALSQQRQIPGHALHEKGLQRQIAVGTLVNSQQRRALAVPRLNR